MTTSTGTHLGTQAGAATDAPVGAGMARIAGDSPLMRQVRASMRQLLMAESALQGALPPPLLLSGETGTGKKSVALALHQDGPRREAPFRVLRCAGLTPQQFEAGCRVAADAAAQTAVGAEIGPLSHGATLVFDEVSELIPELQARLVERLAAWAVPADGPSQPAVRVIATTHRSLDALAQAGLFRADLCFRLGVFRLSLPPLRMRLEDVETLAEQFIAELAPRFGRIRPVLARSAVRRLSEHRWPGNVRELRNAVESALMMNNAPMLTGALFNLVDLQPGRQGVTWQAPALDLASSLDRNLPLGVETLQPLRPDSSATRSMAELATLLTASPSFRRKPSQAERDALIAALELCHWNVCRTAASLNLTRDALRYRMHKYGLSRAGYDRTNSPREPSGHVQAHPTVHPSGLASLDAFAV